MPREEDQEEMCRTIIRKGLSVREAERRVKDWGKRDSTPSIPKEPEDSELRQLQEDLRRCLSTRVRISKTAKGGKIEIDFYSPEELERIVDLILGEKGV